MFEGTEPSRNGKPDTSNVEIIFLNIFTCFIFLLNPIWTQQLKTKEKSYSEIIPNSHNFDLYIASSDATTSTNGDQKLTCTNC